MHFSTQTITTLLTLTSFLLISPVHAYWIDVPLRIEGSKDTIFEGTIRTSGNIITTPSGGTHICDGTNGGAHTTPGATITSAIDDAVKTWDGTWSKSLRDYRVISINGHGETQDQFWRLLVNHRATALGGCQTKVTASDKVLVAFNGFSTEVFLELSADRTEVTRGGRVEFTVVNGANGGAVAGANIREGSRDWGMTNNQGKISVTLNDPLGKRTFKASKDQTIRSNGFDVTVRTAGTHDDGCGCCNE